MMMVTLLLENLWMSLVETQFPAITEFNQLISQIVEIKFIVKCAPDWWI